MKKNETRNETPEETGAAGSEKGLKTRELENGLHIMMIEPR
jgi:hypothetical protein